MEQQSISSINTLLNDEAASYGNMLPVLDGMRQRFAASNVSVDSPVDPICFLLLLEIRSNYRSQSECCQQDEAQIRNGPYGLMGQLWLQGEVKHTHTLLVTGSLADSHHMRT